MGASSPPSLSRPIDTTQAIGGSSHGQAPTREAVLTLLLRHGEATAADLAERLEVSVQVMRRHLRSLEDDALVESSPATEGPGRPSNRWRLTPAGHGRFPDGSERFALGLLQSMTASLPPDALRALMLQQADDKAVDYRRRIGAGSLKQRLERLVELRRGEGYVAELLPADDLEQNGTREAEAWVISEFHCSVMRIAEEFPIVCDQELQLIRHTFPDCRVERVHWRLEEGHSCGFRLSPDPVLP
jgi:DeoR family transcriptional regulator, suf operon transcriptional repressor